MKLDFNIPESSAAVDNFETIQSTINGNPISAGQWVFLEKTFSVGTHRVYHKLGFIPLDVIQTSLIGTGSIAYNYSNFTKDYVEVTVSTAQVTVRFLVGKVG